MANKQTSQRRGQGKAPCWHRWATNQTYCALVLRMDKKHMCSQGLNFLLLKSFPTGEKGSSPSSAWLLGARARQLRNTASPLKGSFLYPTFSQDRIWSTPQSSSPPCGHLCFLSPPVRNNFVSAETPCGSLEFSQLLVTCAEAHAITSFRTGTQDAADSCSLLHSQPEMQAQATTSYPQARPPLCHGTPSSLDIDLPLSFRVARQR